MKMRAFLHETSDVEEVLRTLGFRIIARLDRSARPNEAHGQGFVLATRHHGVIIGASTPPSGANA